VKKSSLLPHALTYGVGNVLVRAAAIILIPIYTRYLSTEEVGIVGLMAITTNMLAIILAFGLPPAAARFYFDYADGESTQAYFGNVLVILLTLSLPLAGVLVLLRGWWVPLVFDSTGWEMYAVLAILIAFAGLPMQLLLALWRASGRPVAYISISLARFLLTVFLIILLVRQMNKGVNGKLVGEFSATFLVGALSVLFLVRYSRFRLSPASMRASLAFGLPLIAHGLGSWVLNASGRYFVMKLTTLAETGIFTIATQLGLVVFIVGQSFDRAWGPYFYAFAGEKDAPSSFGKLATYFFVTMTTIVLCLCVFAREILIILATRDYYESWIVIVPFAVGGLFSCLYYFPIKGLFYVKKTRVIPILTITAATVNVIGNIYLIPKLGIMGSSLATMAAYFTLLCLVLVVSQKHYRIKYRISTLVRCALLAVLTFAVSLLANRYNVYGAIACKCAVMTGYALLLFALGILSREDIQKVKDLAGRVWGNRRATDQGS
jgi:O-antigen/teichoic acid export membrane protein